jgi:hypothetical protein
MIASAASSLMEASGKKAAADADAEESLYRAGQLDTDAANAEDAALAQAQRIRIAGKRTASTARAAYAASGVDVSEGSAKDARADIFENSENDALQQILSGTREAATLRGNAALMRKSADNSRAAGQSAMFGSLLSGAGKAASNWK